MYSVAYLFIVTSYLAMLPRENAEIPVLVATNME